MPPTRNLLIGFAAWTVATSMSPSQASPRHVASFSVLADVPYTDSQALRLTEELKHIPAESGMLFHLGDIKDESVSCTEAKYAAVASILRKSPVPVFITIGDNEWNDCGDPTAAFALWRRYFLRFEQNWSHSFKVARQTARSENFAFLHRGILFIGINVVRGGLSGSEERQRLAQNLDWIKQQYAAHPKARQIVLLGHAGPDSSRAAFYRDVATATARADKPFLLLHGDGHRWIHDRPWSNAPQMLRVQVENQVTPPIVRVSDHPTRPFSLYPNNLLHNGEFDSMSEWTSSNFALDPRIETFNTTGISRSPCYAATLGWRTAAEQTVHVLEQHLTLDPLALHELTFDIAVEFQGDKNGPVVVEAALGGTAIGRESFTDIGSGRQRRRWFARCKPGQSATRLSIAMRRDAVASTRSPRIRIDNVTMTVGLDVALAFQGEPRVGRNIEYVAFGRPRLPYVVFLAGNLLPRPLYARPFDGGFSLLLGPGSFVIHSGVLGQDGSSRADLGTAPTAIAGLRLYWQAVQADLAQFTGDIGWPVVRGFHR